MISKITMFGFKSGVGYQLNKNDERLFERYLLRAEKAALEAKKRALLEATKQKEDNLNEQRRGNFDIRI